MCRVCGVFLIDSHFMVDGGKFISGAMAALSVMVNLEIPHVNILSKVTLRECYGLLYFISSSLLKTVRYANVFFNIKSLRSCKVISASVVR
jgi:hypothetical protein